MIRPRRRPADPGPCWPRPAALAAAWLVACALAAPAVAAGASDPADAGSRPTAALTEIQVLGGHDMEVVAFIASGEVEYLHRRQENPPQLVLDFPSVRLLAHEPLLPAGLRLLRGLRIHEAGEGAWRFSRAVLDLQPSVQVHVGRSPGLVTVILKAGAPAPGSDGLAAVAARHEEPATPATPAAWPAARGGSPEPQEGAGAEALDAPEGEIMTLYLVSPSAPPAGAAPTPAGPAGTELGADRLPAPPLAPLEPATADVPLGPLDLLQVKVLGVDSLERRVRVAADGTITLPLVGSLKVDGLTRDELERKIARSLAEGFVKDPQVSVFVEEYRSRRVSVSGAVRRPGTIEILRPTTLLEVLALAGGVLTDEVGSKVQVVRRREHGTPLSLEVDRIALLGGGLEDNLPIQPGDLIHVPFEETHSVFVQGRVIRPDRYRVPRTRPLTVLQAVALAGGLREGAADKRVEVVRRSPEGRTRILVVNLIRIREGKAPDLPLEPDDIVVVP